MKNKRRLAIILLSALIIILIVAGLYWIFSFSRASSQALSTIETTDQVQVTDDGLLAFEPILNNYNTGIIFYPGGKVDPKAYAPLAKGLAQKGYTTVIVPMPLNLAVLNINAGNEVIQKYPEIKNWIVAGHSLGGSMAVKYYNQNNIEKLKGIILLAAYPDSADDISQKDVKVLSIWGSVDTVLNKSMLDSTKVLLPPSTVYSEIYGGNHSQFGDYGLQSGDNEALIPLSQQQNLTLADIDNFIKSFNL